MTGSPLQVQLRDLEGSERERVVPVLKESFVGIYRWHAKRTLRDADRVRVALEGGEVVGAALLDRLAPEVGYVYYIFVGARVRARGIGRLLLDDALVIFRAWGAQVAYAAAEDDNVASIALFRSRGFRRVERDEEPLYHEGGLGPWGLLSKMMVVHGEHLLGRRL